MKKIILLSTIVITNFAIAQEKISEEGTTKKTLGERKHEVKLGSIKLLAGTIAEGTYEYIKSKDFTFGSSVLVNFDSKNEYPEDFSITPFARFYFQESKEYGAKGFFVEGFAKYLTGKTYNYFYEDDNQGNFTVTEISENFNAASLGISLGKKWINNSGFVFEILIGAGRNVGQSDNAPDASFRGDLNIGYRF